MKYVIVLMIAVAAIFALPHFAMAQEALPLVPAAAAAQTSKTYQEVLRVCGAEWRASPDRAKVEKGKGRDAWNTFRTECVKRQGYVVKRPANKSS